MGAKSSRGLGPSPAALAKLLAIPQPTSGKLAQVCLRELQVQIAAEHQVGRYLCGASAASHRVSEHWQRTHAYPVIHGPIHTWVGGILSDATLAFEMGSPPAKKKA